MTQDWTPESDFPEVVALAHTERLLIALDFDGTCSHLVTEPMSARIVPAVHQQIQRLNDLPNTWVAFVSGRSLPDLRIIAEHSDDSPIMLVGSHGAQFWFPSGDNQPGVAAEAIKTPGKDGEDTASAVNFGEVESKIMAILREYPQVRFEPKSYGFGLHTRGLPTGVGERALAQLRVCLGALLPGWRIIPGDQILEFTARHEGKDEGIRVLRNRVSATAVLFAGDDVTDEDAQHALLPVDLGVKVGSGQSRASLRVGSPELLADLLSRVADARSGVRQ